MTYYQNPYVRQNQYGTMPYYGGGASMQSMYAPTTPVTPPVYTGTMFPTQQVGQTTKPPDLPGQLPLEQSYIENILRLNKGKLATVYAFFDAANGQNQSRTFRGIIEAAGRDHLILSDTETGNRVLIPMVYFGYATFEEELEYDYPIGPVTYPTR